MGHFTAVARYGTLGVVHHVDVHALSGTALAVVCRAADLVTWRTGTGVGAAAGSSLAVASALWGRHCTEEREQGLGSAAPNQGPSGCGDAPWASPSEEDEERLVRVRRQVGVS